jgi:eukaryotic-like serine/threonine-protein kinase
MSPEQARGERNLDGRVDVYACGVVMYEAIVGKRPFLAPNYNALLLAIINTLPKPIRDQRPTIPPELETIITRAMAKNRNDRYPSAAHFLRDLAPAPVPVAEGSGRLPPPPSLEERKRAPVLGGRGPIERERESNPRGRLEGPPSSLHRDAIEATEAAARARAARELSSAKARHADAPTNDGRVPKARESARPPDRVVDPSAFDATIRGTRPPELHVPARRHGANASATESEDSIDIPIHVTEPELEIPLPDDLDEPTEVFHARKHKNPTPLFPPPDRTSSPRGPAPTPTEVERSRPAHYPVPPASDPSVRSSPAPSAPIEDWEGETMVKRPDMTPPSVPFLQQESGRNARPPNPQKPARRPERPFNPDETMKLDKTNDVELHAIKPGRPAEAPGADADQRTKDRHSPRRR